MCLKFMISGGPIVNRLGFYLSKHSHLTFGVCTRGPVWQILGYKGVSVEWQPHASQDQTAARLLVVLMLRLIGVSQDDVLSRE